MTRPMFVVSVFCLLQACNEQVEQRPDPCFDVTCTEGERCDEATGECINPGPAHNEDASSPDIPTLAPDASDAPEPQPAAKPVVLWPYQFHPVCRDGRNDGPDIQRTALAMKDLGATALYLPIGTAGQHDKLLSFLEDTKDTDIKVWVRGHHGCMQEPPPYKGDYRGDCKRWITHLAELSVTYPNLEAVHFDDLHPLRHPDIVTPELIKNVIRVKNKINPSLKFMPALYYDSSDELQFFRPGNPYAGLMKDGASMWYWASHGSKKRVTNTAALQDHVNEGKTLISGTHMTGIYVARYGALRDTGDLETLFHDPAELEEMLRIAYAGSDGICLINFPLQEHDTSFLLESTIFQQQPSDLAAYSHKLTTSKKGTYDSWFQELKTSIAVKKGDAISVKLRLEDNRASGDTGYMYKQLIVDGQVVWEVDLCEDDNKEQSIEHAIEAQGSTAKVSIRLFAKKNNWMNASVYLDEPTLTVNGKPTTAQWQFHSTLAKLDAFRQIYEITKRVVKNLTQK